MSRPLILKPQDAPVVGVDAHLPAVPGSQMTPSALRARLAARASWQPEFAGDGSRLPGRTPAAAAVLVPLVARDDGLRLLLTRRTDHLRDHAGQISFPGGKSEPEDHGPVGTALRETEEEIGLARQHIEVLGKLPVYTTVTAFQVTPVLALVQPPFALQLDSSEVAEAFEVPLEYLMNPAHHRHHAVVLEGIERRFISMPWQGPECDYFIWGATAAMLRNLYRLLVA